MEESHGGGGDWASYLNIEAREEEQNEMDSDLFYLFH